MTDFTIDGYKASVFCCALVDYTVGSTQFTPDYISRGWTHQMLSCDEGTRTMTITVEVRAKTGAQTREYLSHLTAALKGHHKIRVGDEFVYDTILTDLDEPEVVLPNWIMQTYTFDTICLGERPQPAAITCGTLYCRSTAAKTPCIITIRPTLNIAQLGVLGIKINDLKRYDVWIVNSVAKTVTKNGDNAFESIVLKDGVDFPYLIPGENQIGLTQTVNGTIEHEPIYI